MRVFPVFVLLYNVGTDNEGIHTLRVGDRDVILMFHSEDDALRFAILLEAQDFPEPTPVEVDPKDIEAFCRDAGYEWQEVEEGTLVVPPESNLEETEWDPNKPPPEPESELDRIRRQLEAQIQGKTPEPPVENPAENPEEPSEMSQSELDRIRRNLEGLL